jgi:hypothetical protein
MPPHARHELPFGAADGELVHDLQDGHRLLHATP